MLIGFLYVPTTYSVLSILDLLFFIGWKTWKLQELIQRTLNMFCFHFKLWLKMWLRCLCDIHCQLQDRNTVENYWSCKNLLYFWMFCFCNLNKFCMVAEKILFQSWAKLGECLLRKKITNFGSFSSEKSKLSSEMHIHVRSYIFDTSFAVSAKLVF